MKWHDLFIYFPAKQRSMQVRVFLLIQSSTVAIVCVLARPPVKVRNTSTDSNTCCHIKYFLSTYWESGFSKWPSAWLNTAKSIWTDLSMEVNPLLWLTSGWAGQNWWVTPPKNWITDPNLKKTNSVTESLGNVSCNIITGTTGNITLFHW